MRWIGSMEPPGSARGGQPLHPLKNGRNVDRPRNPPCPREGSRSRSDPSHPCWSPYDPYSPSTEGPGLRRSGVHTIGVSRSVLILAAVVSEFPEVFVVAGTRPGATCSLGGQRRRIISAFPEVSCAERRLRVLTRRLRVARCSIISEQTEVFARQRRLIAMPSRSRGGKRHIISEFPEV